MPRYKKKIKSLVNLRLLNKHTRFTEMKKALKRAIRAKRKKDDKNRECDGAAPD